jgi:hypothetical protein
MAVLCKPERPMARNPVGLLVGVVSMNLNTSSPQRIADIACDYFGIEPIKVYVRNTFSGRARIGTRKITIPVWAKSEGLNYLRYYVVHEVAHFATWDFEGTCKHDADFKVYEQCALEDLWNITIEYAKAYPKRMYANGRKIHDTEKWK